MLSRFLLILPLFTAIAGISQREHSSGMYLGFGKTNSITADVIKNFKLLKKENLHIGVGARGGLIYTANVISFYTAPAKHTKDNSGIDTITVNKPMSIPVNMNVSVSYFLTKKLSAGIIIDLVGFTFGGKKKSNFYPSAKLQESQGKRTVLEEQNAKPMVNNFNMIGNYRKGTTLNEVFVRYKFHERYSIKASYLIITSEYISENRIGYKSNYRFRNTSSQVSFGLSYHFI